jgi:hypothetical protein
MLIIIALNIYYMGFIGHTLIASLLMRRDHNNDDSQTFQKMQCH